MMATYILSLLLILEFRIDQYLKYYREIKPGQIYPKLHILESHCVDFIKRWGYGLGLHGEQGGEQVSIKNIINNTYIHFNTIYITISCRIRPLLLALNNIQCNFIYQ